MKFFILLALLSFSSTVLSFDFDKCYTTEKINGKPVQAGPDLDRSLNSMVFKKSAVFFDENYKRKKVLLIHLFKGFSRGLYTQQGIPMFVESGEFSHDEKGFNFYFKGDVFYAPFGNYKKVDYLVNVTAINKTNGKLALNYFIESHSLKIDSHANMLLVEADCR